MFGMQSKASLASRLHLAAAVAHTDPWWATYLAYNLADSRAQTDHLRQRLASTQLKVFRDQGPFGHRPAVGISDRALPPTVIGLAVRELGLQEDDALRRRLQALLKKLAD